MSTTKPRITISLEPHTYEVLRRLSEANGRPMSAAVTDFLELGVPSMERLVLLLERARQVPEEQREGVRKALESAEAAMAPSVAAALAQGDLFFAASEAAMSAAGGASREPRSGERVAPEVELTPVPVTRGSGRRIVPHSEKRGARK